MIIAYYLKQVSFMPVWMKTAHTINSSTAVMARPDLHKVSGQEL